MQTKLEVDRLLAEIEVLSKRLYQTSRRHRKLAIPKGITKVAKKQKVNFNNRQELEDFLTKFKKTLMNLPTVSLTLAFSPSKVLIKKLAAWVKENVGPAVILEIKTDTTILGGLILSFQGRYQDLSLKKKLEERFMIHESRFTNILKS